jgi:hypothetical protein
MGPESEAAIRGFQRGAATASQPRYWVASDGYLQMHAGRIAGTVVSPVGAIHAVDGYSDQALCGASLLGLHEFPDRDYVTVRGAGRCPACAAEASPPPGGDATAEILSYQAESAHAGRPLAE